MHTCAPGTSSGPGGPALPWVWWALLQAPGSDLAPGWVTAPVSILWRPGVAPAAGPRGLGSDPGPKPALPAIPHAQGPWQARLCRDRVWTRASRASVAPGPPSLATARPVEAPPSMCPSIWVTSVTRDTALVPCGPSLPAHPPWPLLLPESWQALSPESGEGGLVTPPQEAP